MKSESSSVLCGMVVVMAMVALSPLADAAPKEGDFVGVVRQVQPKIVKIFGAGGLRGMEAYQSGILIDPPGYVLTVSSYVLDADEVTLVLDDGRRFDASLVGIDPVMEIAILRFDPGEESVSTFDLSRSASSDVGGRVLAFNNLFGIATGNEAVSALHGTVAAVAPLAARRGAAKVRYRGDVYVVDAIINNPGAAGGALADVHGELLGLIGKEARSQLTNTWLNFALPVDAFSNVVEDIVAGRHQLPPLDELNRPNRPLGFGDLGIILVPDVVARTPAYVDRVMPGSAAAREGIQVDDLVVMVDGNFVSSCRECEALIARNEVSDQVKVVLLRGDEVMEVVLQLREQVEK